MSLRPVAAVCAAVALAGCSTGPVTHAASTAPAGWAAARVDRGTLVGLLLTPAEVAGLPQRRVYASSTLTHQATPQLTLCSAAVQDQPHEVANVLAESPLIGTAKVFEILNVYADPAAARASYDRALEEARRCQAHPTEFTLDELAPLTVVGAQALHYRLSTPGLVGGDVRTFAQRGRFTVLITGYGRPPDGQPLLDYQLVLLRRALTRLG